MDHFSVLGGFLSGLLLGIWPFAALAWICASPDRKTLRILAPFLVWLIGIFEMMFVPATVPHHTSGDAVVSMVIAFGAGHSLALFRTSRGWVLKSMGLVLLLFYLALLGLGVSRAFV